MAPHFEAAADISAVPELMQQIADIRAASDDPLAQMALATQLVQDEVSYLLNGLDGGNYLPQEAAETWDKRYGDCKAKSVLLLAMLRELGIESHSVLVASRGGDAVPELLPLPANFDHMIVHASVDGTDYWLDGTSAGTRRSNIGDVPPFYYALPLTGEGSGLATMEQRRKEVPDMAMLGRFDLTAGTDLPQLYALEITMSGQAASGMRAFVDNATTETKRQMAQSFTSSMGSGEVTSIDVSYDDDDATALLVVKGVTDSDFTFDEGKVSMDLATFTSGVNFNPDRARKAWREIPVRTNGPGRVTVKSVYDLPTGGTGFALEGDSVVEGGAANVEIKRSAALDGRQLRVSEDVSSQLGEIAPDQLTDQKLAARRLSSKTLSLKSEGEPQWRWEVSPRELAQRIKPLEAAYTTAIKDREDDEFGPYLSRAAFYQDVYMHKHALADVDAVLAEEPTAGLHLNRAYLLFDLKDNDGMEAALARAYELDPANSTAFFQAEMLSRFGRHDEALALMETLPVSEEDRDGYAENMALNAGRAGDIEEGLAIIAERLAKEPQNASPLNADCWYRGLHSTALDEATAQCTRAVERAEYPANVLDSRALAHYRMGDFDAARADLDDALRLSPGLAASRFLRGVVRLEQGDGEGREDLAIARRISHAIGDFYALYGIKAE